MVFITAIFSAFFWIDAAKIGDVFQFGSDTVSNRPGAISVNSTEIQTATTTPPEVLPSKIKNAEKLMPATTTATTTAPVSPVQKLIKKVETILPSNGTLSRAGVIAQTNKQRQANLGAGHDLKENSLLDIAAQNKVDDMFSGQYFEHTSPQGLDAGDLATAAGYEYVVVGENLAMGDYKEDADLMQAWMKSPGHRENILRDDYREIGAAVGYGTFNGRKTWLAVQEFGTSKTACPQTDSNLSARIDRQKTVLDGFTAAQAALSARIDGEKQAAETLKSELENLIAARASNNEIKAKQDEYNRTVAAVNKDVGDYNAAAQQIRQTYNDYKADVDSYNAQINTYNACVASFK